MKNTIIGVISYLPETSHRQKRLKVSRLLFETLKQKFPDTKIICVSQCYHDDEYIDGIEFVKFDKGIGGAKARDVLFSRLYNSNYDWLFFLDDDCFFKDVYNPTELLEILDENPQATPLDLITSIDPSKCGWRKPNIIRKDIVEENFTFTNPIRQVPLALLRNLKKYYNKEIYMGDVEQDPHKNFLCEDLLWVKDLVANGMKVRSCQQWIQYNKCMTTSIIIDDQKDKNCNEWHNNILNETMKVFTEKYNLNERNPLGDFRKKYDVLCRADNTQFNIKRKTHFEFGSEELKYSPRKFKTKEEQETGE